MGIYTSFSIGSRCKIFAFHRCSLGNFSYCKAFFFFFSSSPPKGHIILACNIKIMSIPSPPHSRLLRLAVQISGCRRGGEDGTRTVGGATGEKCLRGRSRKPRESRRSEALYFYPIMSYFLYHY